MGRAKAKSKTKPASKTKKPKAKAKPEAKPASKAKAKPKPAPKTKRVLRAKTPAAIAAPTFHVPIGAARQRLRDALAWVEDFVVECARLASEDGPLPWEHADAPLLVGLERWGTQLAHGDRGAGVCALVLAAQYGFPRVLAVGGAELDSMGFRGAEVLDGATVESQLDRCARWIDDPSDANGQDVTDGFDPTRQLHTWDPELQPHDTKSFFWYSEIGQLASAAVVKDDGDAASTSYYYWPATVSAGRGLVVAVRGLRTEGTDVEAILRDIHAALIA